MISTRILALPALALVAVLTGCNDSQTAANSDLLKQNDDLTKQLAEKDDKLNAMGEQLARAQQQANDLQGQLEACNKHASATPAPAAKEVASTVDAKDFQGIEGVEATVQNGDIHLSIANNLLFDSGKTALKDTSRKSLDKVSATIKEKYGEREIMVIGYTDSDPIHKSSFASNYHLGFERAYAVRGYLDRKGVNGQHMGLGSFGPDRPLASKEKSRRVEVIVSGHSAATGTETAKAEHPKNAPAAAGKAAAAKSTDGKSAARGAAAKTAPLAAASRKATKATDADADTNGK